MPHEITNEDSLLLSERPAWHGLGRVVEDAPTIDEAWRMSGLDWAVGKKPIYRQFEAEPIPGYAAVVREDTDRTLSVVSSDYEPIQNRTMFDVAKAIADQCDAKIESTGSVKRGLKTWLLVRGASFAPGGLASEQDTVYSYLMLSNAHDGRAALRVKPTSIRVVCNNTLSMAEASSQAPVWRINHWGDANRRIGEVVQAVRQWAAIETDFRKMVGALAERGIRSQSELQEFWTDVYQRLVGPIPTNPQTGMEERRRTRATQVMGDWASTFDRQKPIAGASAWNAVNCVTQWVQHKRRAGSSVDVDKRLHYRMFGGADKASSEALGMGLELV